MITFKNEQYPCEECNGFGGHAGDVCSACGGTGIEGYDDCECPNCNGSGMFLGEDCLVCGGSGEIV